MNSMATGGKRKGRTRTGIAAVWLGGLVATAIVEGCDGNSPPEQSGTQLLAGRDFGNLFFWNEQTPAFTRQTTAPGAGNQDLWVWPDGESAPAAGAVADRLVPAESGRPRIMRRRHLDDRPPRRARLRPATADGARSADDCRSGDAHEVGIDWASLRRDGGSLVAHRGNRRPVRGTRLDFHILATRRTCPGKPTSWGTTSPFWPAHRIDQPTRELIYRMALPSGDMSPLPVPPLAHVLALLAVRDAAVPDVPRRRLRRRRRRLSRDRPRAVRDPLPARRRADRTSPQPYVFDVNTGQETALPGERSQRFVLSPDRHSAAWMHYDLDDPAAGKPPDQTPIYVHNFCSGAAVQCPLPGPRQLSWRSDSERAGRRSRRQPAGAGRRSHRHLQRLRRSDGQRQRRSARLLSRRAIGWPGPRSTPGDPPVQMLWVSDAAGGEPRMLANGVFSVHVLARWAGDLHHPRQRRSAVAELVVALAADSPHQQLIADAYRRGRARQPARAGHRSLERAGRIGNPRAGRSRERHAPGAGARGHRRGRQRLDRRRGARDVRRARALRVRAGRLVANHAPGTVNAARGARDLAPVCWASTPGPAATPR